MDPGRIAELLQPFLASADDQSLTAVDLFHISTYIDLLQRWNSRINLTAIRDPDEIVTRHFGESLFAARHLFPLRLETFERAAKPDDRVGPEDAANIGPEDAADAGRGEAANARPEDAANAGRREAANARPENAANVGLEHAAGKPRGRAALQGRDQPLKHPRALAPAPTLADVGSGAGFPGIPIKLWAPHISLTLIESNQKKATFLREAARALTLTDIDIQTARAEALPARSFDVVTLRAVERFANILPIAAQLVGPAGRLALLIGAAQQDQARQILPSLLWQNPMPVPNSNSRVLLIAQAPALSGT